MVEGGTPLLHLKGANGERGREGFLELQAQQTGEKNITVLYFGNDGAFMGGWLFENAQEKASRELFYHSKFALCSCFPFLPSFLVLCPAGRVDPICTPL